MKEIKGILFDKDGTLLDFHSGWVPVAIRIVNQLLERVGRQNELSLQVSLLEAIGLHGNRVEPKGILASGTTQDMSEVFRRVLLEQQVDPAQLEDLEGWLTEGLYQQTLDNRHNLRPTADLQHLFTQLRRQGLKIGIATADDLESTIYFLELVGVVSYIDFIGTSDHYEKKPSPSMMRAFCEISGLRAEEVAVVGDTETDIRFARNSSAGMAIGVLSGVSGLSDLQDLADLVIPSVADIVQADERWIWQKDTNQQVSSTG
ncbi:HAD family hydrolase [Paenibacillus guangzhouensis]|uniref:HAD family hydrolase n=1 Tax=Paenibacillus guangzhouensis TaxID=1473112 RepID=UPI001266D5BA|nr:HAD family hydrolase [Paenibacillus guangzhouensis]